MLQSGGGPRSNSLCHKDLRGAKSGATGVKSGAEKVKSGAVEQSREPPGVFREFFWYFGGKFLSRTGQV